MNRWRDYEETVCEWMSVLWTLMLLWIFVNSITWIMIIVMPSESFVAVFDRFVWKVTDCMDDLWLVSFPDPEPIVYSNKIA